jgi:hypothetical protein
LRQALRAKGGGNRGSITKTYSIPAPIGGWNARDALADMDERDAVYLDNWFPETTSVGIRKGNSAFCTVDAGTAVESVMEYGGTTRKLFAVANTTLYDVSSGTASSSITGLANARFQHVNFGTAGGQFLIIVNGSDTPRNFNGTSWDTAPAITGSGLTSSNLIHVNSYQQRLFFIEKNTMNYWYLDVNSIGGTASKVNLSSLFRHGGYLMAMGTWTRDGGSGPDDLAVFITSEGEIAVYSGTNPGDASLWSLVGIFRIGKPIGRRCFEKFGSDLAIVTSQGVVPLSRVLVSVDGQGNELALSSKIQSAFNDAVITHGAKYGWQPILYPDAHMMLVNIPTSEGSTAEQYVVNTITGAWCKFTNWDASSWSLFSGNLYFGGGDGIVYQAWTGQDDNGSNISADGKQAFSYLKSRRQKQVKMVRPVITADGDLTAILSVSVDFEDKYPIGSTTSSTTSGSPWDTSSWDVSDWGSSGEVAKNWTTVSAVGYAVATRMIIATAALTVSWQSTDFLYEDGGVL